MSVASFLDEEALLNDPASEINITKEDELALIGTTTDLPDNNSLQDESTTQTNALLSDKVAESANGEALVAEQSEPATSNHGTWVVPPSEATKTEPETQAAENDSDIEMLDETEPDSVETLKWKLASYEKGMRELRTKLRRERAQHREECSTYEARIKELENMLGKQTTIVVPKTEIKEEPVEQMTVDPPVVSTPIVAEPTIPAQPDNKTKESTIKETERTKISERFTTVRRRRSSSSSSDKGRKRSRDRRRPTTEARKHSSRSDRREDRTEKKKDVVFGPSFIAAIYNPPKESDKENKKSSRGEERRKTSRRPEREKKEIKVEWMHIKECRFNCRNCGFDNDVMKRELLLRALDRDKSTAPDYVKNTNNWISVEDRWFFCKGCDQKVEIITAEDIEKKKKILEERRDKRDRSYDRHTDRRRRRSRSRSLTRRNGIRTNNRVDRKRAHSKDETNKIAVKRQMSRIESQRAVDQHLKRTTDFEKGSLRATEELSFDQKEELAMKTLKSLAYEPRMMLICGLGHELPPLLEEMAQDPKTGHPWRKMRRDRLATKEVLDTYTLEKRETLRAQYNIKEPLAEHVKNPELAQNETGGPDRLESWLEDFEDAVGPSTSHDSRSMSSEGEDEVYLSD